MKIYHNPRCSKSRKTLDLIKQINQTYSKKIKNVIGKNTVKAVRSGFFWGYVGLINNIIELIQA